MARSTRTTLLAALLAAGALGLLVTTLRTPPERPPLADQPASAQGPTGDIFLGCLVQTGPDAFSLAVSRVLPDDPLRIETYALVGSGGLPLADHVGHTLRVTGQFEGAGDAFPRLRVSSAQHVAVDCWKP
jgi:hypothetical protein